MGSGRSIGNRHVEIVGTGNQRSSREEVENTGQRIDRRSGRKRRTGRNGPSVSRKRSTSLSQDSDRGNVGDWRVQWVPVSVRVINGAVEQISVSRVWDRKLWVGGE